MPRNKRKIQIQEDSVHTQTFLKMLDDMKFRLDRRYRGKPIVCEMLNSATHDLVELIPGKESDYIMLALRQFVEDESITLKRKDNDELIRGTLHNCRKAQRKTEHRDLYLVDLNIASETS